MKLFLKTQKDQIEFIKKYKNKLMNQNIKKEKKKAFYPKQSN